MSRQADPDTQAVIFLHYHTVTESETSADTHSSSSPQQGDRRRLLPVCWCRCPSETSSSSVINCSTALSPNIVPLCVCVCVSASTCLSEMLKSCFCPDSSKHFPLVQYRHHYIVFVPADGWFIRLIIITCL